MRYGIPNYRLPDSVLDFDFQHAIWELKGIKVRPNTTIGKTITIDDLFHATFHKAYSSVPVYGRPTPCISRETKLF